MVQHINLLAKHGASKGFDWYAPRGVLLLLVAMLVYTGNGELHLQRLREAQARTDQSVLDLKATLERKRREVGLQDIEAINKQMVALRAQVDARRGWGDLMQKGELGTPRGYAWIFESLAETHQDGVWLRRVELGKGEQSMAIEGSALSSDAVLRYADQVNQSFKSMGVQFSSMEIVRGSQDPGATGASAAGVLKFKIF